MNAKTTLEKGLDPHGVSLKKGTKVAERTKAFGDIVAGILRSQKPITIDVPETLIDRSFAQGKTDTLKDKFKFLLKSKSLDEVKTKFLRTYELIEEVGERDYKHFHTLEVLFYILQSTAPDFLADPKRFQPEGFTYETLKNLAKKTLIPFVVGGVHIFQNTKKHHDIKKLRKILKFRKILHSYGWSDGDIKDKDGIVVDAGIYEKIESKLHQVAKAWNKAQ